MRRPPFPAPALVALVITLLLGPTLIDAQDQAATPAPVGRYEVTDLGTLGGTYSVALGVNQAGQVVGQTNTGPDQELFGPGSRAFLWEEGSMTDLGTLGGETSAANDINGAGQVIGFSETADATERAFLWENGTMTDLGTLGGDFSRATGINDAGQVVGTSETADAAIHPFLWENGNMTDLGTIPGFAGGRAISMNEEGSVVGFAVDPLTDDLATPAAGPPLGRHAWLYRDGELIDLGTLGGTNSAALGINADGLVVGWADIPFEQSQAEATPVVNFGISTFPDAPAPRAFVWADGVMSDLNELSSGGELVLETAFEISDGGHIVGGAVVGEAYRAFLLTPSA